MSIKSHAVQQIRKGNRLIQNGQVTEGVAAIQDGWKIAPDNEDILLASAGTLVDAGYYQEAIDLIQASIQYQADKPTLYDIAGMLANRMELYDIAEKFYRMALQTDPALQSAYVGLVTSLTHLNEQDKAIEILQSVLPQFPTNAELWNLLGTITRLHKRDFYRAETFYLEAYKHNPNSTNILLNLSNLYDGSEKAEKYFNEALKLDPKNPLLRFNYGMYLLSRGRIEKAWRYYDSRLDSSFGVSKVAQFPYKIPFWKGESLKRKTIFLIPEQGIGDEVFFSHLFGQVYKVAKHVYIGCEPRLVSIYKRNYPEATVWSFEDEISQNKRIRRYPELDALTDKPPIDYAVYIGSLPRFFWTSKDKMQGTTDGHLQPDPTLVDTLSSLLQSKSNVKKIGISWRSGKQTMERSIGYMQIESVLQLAQQTDALFINLQYDINAEETRALRKQLGDRFIHHLEVDLKADIEANLAIASLCDLVIGPAIAPQMFALSTGVPTWIINHGQPWWLFGATDGSDLIFASKSTCFSKDSPQSWSNFISNDLLPRLEEFMVKPDTDDPEAYYKYSLFLLSCGRLPEAWGHFKKRPKPTLPSKINNQGKEWQGEPLKGKRILILPESDPLPNVLFAHIYALIAEQAASVLILTDDTLYSTYKRSFPDCEIYIQTGDKDTIHHAFDYYTWAGTLAQYYWQDTMDMFSTPSGFMQPDVTPLEEYKSLLPGNKNTKIIGLSLTGDKDEVAGQQNIPAATLGALVTNERYFFILLDNHLPAKELQTLKNTLGDQLLDIPPPTGVEEILALTHVCDAIIGPASTQQMIAISGGSQTLLIGKKRPWWAFGRSEIQWPRFAKNCKFTMKCSNETWEDFSKNTLEPKLQKLLE